MAYPNHERLIMAGALIRQIAGAVFSFTTSEFQSPYHGSSFESISKSNSIGGKTW